jgi:hypothetical protein
VSNGVLGWVDEGYSLHTPIIFAAPFVVEMIWLAAFFILNEWAYPNLSTHPSQGLVPFTDGNEIVTYIDEQGRPVGKMGWVRRIELGYIAYHIPILAPVSYFGLSGQYSQWRLPLLTPILYSALLYLALR